MKIFIIVAAIVATFYSCQDAPAELTQEKKDVIVNEIRQRLDGYREALKRKDVEWFREFWANDKEFAVALDGELATDYDPWFQKNYVEGIPGIKAIQHFKFGDGKGIVLNENAVSYATTFDWGMITAADDTVQSKGSIIHVFERMDGNWKCIQTGGTHTYY